MSSNPILRDEEMSRWSIGAPRPVPRADTCLVFVDGSGAVHAPDQPITLGRAVWGNLRRLYEIDLAEQTAQLSLPLPCAELGFYFDAGLDLRWKVHDPATVVRDRRKDVDPVFHHHLTDFLGGYSEHYHLDQRARAENELRDKLREPMVLPEGLTIVRCRIALTLGDAAEAHLRQRTETGFRLETGRLNFEVDKQTGEHRGEHQKRQAGLQAELDDLRRTSEIKEQAHKNEIDRLELEAKFKRMGMYEQALQAGHNSALMFMLDQHRGDIGPVIELVIAQRKTNLENSRELAMGLVDRGYLGGADIDPAARSALQNLIDGLDPAGLDLALGAPARAEPAAELPAKAGDHVTEGRVVDNPAVDDEDDEYDDD